MRIPESMRARLSLWARQQIALHPKPTLTVGEYLWRWRVLPVDHYGKWYGLYIHKFWGDDDDAALHDHPYGNISIILEGGYDEHVFVHKSPLPSMTIDTETKAIRRNPGDVVIRRASTPHRLSLVDGRPALSLFLMGPRVRDWGFHCGKGFVPWRRFLSNGPDGKQKGCD